MFFFIPYGTDRPARVAPVVTFALIGINIIVFVWQSSSPLPEVVLARYAFIPSHLNSVSWFTYMFMHGSLGHLAGNMLFLWLFGSALECALGWWIFLPTYLLSGCVAMMLHYLIVTATDPAGANTYLVGASGAIAGLLGMYALRFHQTKIRVWYFVLLLLFIRWGKFEIGSVWFIAIWVAQQIFGASATLFFPELDSTVAYWTHLGGFGLGMLYGLLVNLYGEGKSEYVLADAAEAFARQDFQQALRLAGEVARREPTNAEARLLHLRSAMRIRPAAEFISEFESLLKEALRCRNHALVEDLYTELGELHPNASLDPRLLLATATVFAEMGKYEKAAQIHRRLMQDAPRVPEAEVSMLRYAQLCLEHLGRREEAAAVLRRFQVIYPHSQWKDFAERLVMQTRYPAA